MTYQEFIQNIINTRGQWGFTAEEIYEIHHILPRCMGGLPLKIHTHVAKHPNLIWLTPREHYIAHRLLVETYPDNLKLIYAFWRISNRHTVTAEEYATARELYIQARKASVQAPEANLKRSQAMKQHNLRWYTNGETELRATECPEGFWAGRAKKISDISKKCFGKALVGEQNGMYGKRQSAESNKKRSEWSSSRRWYNNGQVEVFEVTCPNGFIKGRLKRCQK